MISLLLFSLFWLGMMLACMRVTARKHHALKRYYRRRDKTNTLK